MINKIYKTINNKYSKFFKFLLFLKYVFAIFLIAILLFISIPKFFNYEKKQVILKDYLVNYYELELINFNSIEFKVFPLPNLYIKGTNLKVKNKPIFINTKNLNIFLNFKNIYNYENFKARKILLKDNTINLDIEKTDKLFDYFANLKDKFDIKKLNLILKKKESSIIEIKKIYFSNYGYKKNNIKGEIFDKKFKASLDNNYKNLNFKILNTGINANFNFEKPNQKNSLIGSSKINVLNNYLKFNFLITNDKLEISKANLRNKNLSIFFDGLVNVNPFFEAYSNIRINKIDERLIDKLNLEKILENKEILKKFNSNNKVSYNKKKKWRNSLIDSHYSEFNLSYGSLAILSQTSIPGGEIDCKGNSLLIEEYPRLSFNCFFNIKNQKKFLNNFIPSKKFSKDTFNLNIQGSLNLFNKKINFDKINIDNKYTAKEKDIVFFKETFERILFNESFFNIFNMDKIKEFLNEAI